METVINLLMKINFCSKEFKSSGGGGGNSTPLKKPSVAPPPPPPTLWNSPYWRCLEVILMSK